MDRNLLTNVVSSAGTTVALRKESVDRNDKSKKSKTEKRSRSPQGERG